LPVKIYQKSRHILRSSRLNSGLLQHKCLSGLEKVHRGKKIDFEALVHQGENGGERHEFLTYSLYSDQHGRNDTAVMKRLVPFLILAVFFLGISGGGPGHGHVTLKICTSPQSYPQIAPFLPCEDVSGNWDAANQPLSLPGHIVYTPKPPRADLHPGNYPGQTPPKHYAWLGLGCGGLPS
jgi:hypothetical protein